MDGLKKSVDALESNWVDELINVLWVIRTTPKKSTGEIPFCLIYGLKEVLTHSARRFNNEVDNDEKRLELDMVDEKCWSSEETQVRMRLAMACYYSRRILTRQFLVG